MDLPYYRQASLPDQSGAKVARETLAHCRRKFYEALPAERKKSIKLLDINSLEALKEPEIPTDDLDKYFTAEIGVAYCNKLFYLERIFKELSSDERKDKRLEQEIPVWKHFLA